MNERAKVRDNKRCTWAESDPLLRDYHDREWGVVVRDPRALWEMLVLEGFQAGLSWLIILRKRDAFRKAFAGFDPHRVARFGRADVARLLANEGIIRSRAKIDATIASARIFVAMEAAGEDFGAWIWSLAPGAPIRGAGPIQPKTPLSEAVSKALKKRGFKFVGPVIVQSFLQAVGIVDDHAPDCFRAPRPGARRR
jgi:DNA-3-methyladenine glycosylase I